jgi:Tol biopolymer transport system component
MPIANRLAAIMLIFSGLTSLLVVSAMAIGRPMKSQELAYKSWTGVPDEYALSIIDVARQLEYRPIRLSVGGYYQWSADGQYLLFATNPPRENGNLYILNVETGRITNLTPKGFIGYVSVSPDSRYVVFLGATTHWYSLDLTNFSLRQASEKPLNLGDSSPTWSPDGNFIAGSFREMLRIMAVEDEGIRLFSATTGDNINQLAWSPDSEKLIFSTTHWGGGGALYLLDVVGESMTKLTDSELNYVAGIDWSPDGRQVIFVSRDSLGHAEIHTWEVATGAFSQLTHQASAEGYPRWSPDGRQIAFVSCASGCDIVVMDTDGSHLTRVVTRKALLPPYLAWRPQ